MKQSRIRNVRSKTIVVRVTNAEFQMFMKASLNERSLSEWLRLALTTAAKNELKGAQ